MKITDKVSMAFKDLMNRKVRSILTILAVSIGSLLLIVMMGLSDGIVNKLKDMLSSFGDTNIVQVYPIDNEKAESGSMDTSIQVTDVGEEDETTQNEENNENSMTKKILNEDLESIKNIDGVEKLSAYVQGSVTEVRRQIGNAVPPEGVRLLAKRLLSLFTGEYEPVDLIPEYEKMKKMTVKERLEYVTSQMN